MYRKIALLVAFVLTGAGTAANSADPNISQRPDVIAFKAAMDPTSGPSIRGAVFQKAPFSYRSLGPPGGYFPERALRMAISAAAVVQCSMAATGGLSDCSVLAEAPGAFGFGVASLKMAKSGYLSAKPDPADQDGQAVRVVVVFKNPGAR
jgi:TonB family protein